MDLAFKKVGSGTPLVILHGLFGMSDNWMSIAKALSDKYTFYLLDLRNHGHSPHTDNIDFPLMAEDVVHFLDTHNLKKVILLGHSLGGKVAIQVADKYPSLLSKLIVVDIANREYKSTWFEDYIDVMLGIDLEDIHTRKEAEQSFLTQKNVEITVVQFLLKNLYRNEKNEFCWWLNLKALKNNMTKLLAHVELTSKIGVHTLFIKGANSHYISAEDEAVIQNSFLNSHIVTIPGANHWVHAAAPQLFIKELNGFIS